MIRRFRQILWYQNGLPSLGWTAGHFSSSSVPFITCARGSLSAGGCVFSPNTVYTWFDFHHKLASRVILGFAGGPRVDISVPVSQFLLEQVLCHLCAALLQTCQRRGVSICQGDRRLVRGQWQAQSNGIGR